MFKVKSNNKWTKRIGSGRCWLAIVVYTISTKFGKNNRKYYYVNLMVYYFKQLDHT